jgi:hypothetical protein
VNEALPRCSGALLWDDPQHSLLTRLALLHGLALAIDILEPLWASAPLPVVLEPAHARHVEHLRLQDARFLARIHSYRPLACGGQHSACLPSSNSSQPMEKDGTGTELSWGLAITVAFKPAGRLTLARSEDVAPRALLLPSTKVAWSLSHEREATTSTV